MAGNVSIYGLYFKPWLFSAIIGIVAAFIFTRIIDLTPARAYFSNPVVLPALTIIFGFVVWAVFFHI